MTSDPILTFIDADVLAAPMTRTILILSSLLDGSKFTPRWSPAVESEADLALRRGQTPVAELRQRFDWGTDVLVPDATDEDTERLIDTAPNDRHVLSATSAAGIRVLVSRNVHDFGRSDLDKVGVCVANPDLFLSVMVNAAGYRQTLEIMAAGRRLPPKTPEDLHAAICAVHPRLFAKMRDCYPHIRPNDLTHEPPTEVFRGSTCLLCGRSLGSQDLTGGVCPRCRN